MPTSPIHLGWPVALVVGLERVGRQAVVALVLPDKGIVAGPIRMVVIMLQEEAVAQER